MLNQPLKDQLTTHILPRVQTPGQYLGGELNMVRKDHRRVRGKLCLAFPDTYRIGMSCHGLQVLYRVMNDCQDWVCERAFAPWVDMEAELRRADLPLYSLETFTPLCQFDVLGFTLQYELCASNVLTMLDLGRIPLDSRARSMADPLVIAGGPCAMNPEPLAPLIDLFVLGDGELALPWICARWLAIKASCSQGDADQRDRAVAQLAAQTPFAYAPRLYQPEYDGDGRFVRLRPTHDNVPDVMVPAVVSDLDRIALPTAPLVPYVECVQDRIAIEIMRGCPWQCRFCQSTVTKRPLRVRSVATIVAAALASFHQTGYDEVSLLALSSSDYPRFEELVSRLRDAFLPLGVHISIPSLRVNEQLQSVARLIPTSKRSGLTLAPEVARDEMRVQIGKKINNEDLFAGCREAFRNGFEHVKLYFLCGLPGEQEADLRGIVEMAETIARIGRQQRGRSTRVVASVSNFVPKAHTPYQWHGMQTRDYFVWAHRMLRRTVRLRSVQIKCHDIDSSLMEGVLSRGDRRVARAVETAWRRGARFDSWSERFDADRWWQALADSGIDRDAVLHRPRPVAARLPWDHIQVGPGRAHLAREYARSVAQLSSMVEEAGA
ncbi:MAG: B12-binding domain-containing radical SAM protein [Planctomycetes bacterium RBG_16_64_10]|nr:MAG: B12-binding domain-containing radical SAM protein [Planctomycetes bacterium RBG_16_64_10]